MPLAARQRLQMLYEAPMFRQAVEVWSEMLIRHLEKLSSREVPVQKWCEPASAVDEAMKFIRSAEVAPASAENWELRLHGLLERMLDRGQNLLHPRYVGHQVPASMPLAGLFDAIGSITNQVMAIYEMGPWATAVERAMIARLGQQIGYSPGTFTGIITHGGSLANLTALLTARNVALQNCWQQGVPTDVRPVLLVQEDAHYCVVRSAGILGLGTDQVIKIPVDGQRKMDVSQLDRVLSELATQSRPVIAVAAAACATPIGAFDRLNEVADVCEKHRVWLHVDAAHGGSALWSDQHRHLLAGMDRADSVVWDAHKMMFVPALCAFAFYKDKRHQFAAFQQDAPYLFDPTDPGIAEYDSGTQTVECTKRAAAFGLWGMWSLFGPQLFADLVDNALEQAATFHAKLSAAADFQPLHEPECNIQVFRYLPEEIRQWTEPQQGEFQLKLRRAVVTEGNAYIVPIKLNGSGALRTTFMNPTTTADDMDVVLDEIRRVGRQLLTQTS